MFRVEARRAGTLLDGNLPVPVLRTSRLDVKSQPRPDGRGYGLSPLRG
jgi:hypothetical protein